MKCEHINVHLNNTVFWAGNEEVLLVPNNLVTKVTMTKKTLQSYLYYKPNHVCMTKLIKRDLGFPYCHEINSIIALIYLYKNDPECQSKCKS